MCWIRRAVTLIGVFLFICSSDVAVVSAQYGEYYYSQIPRKITTIRPHQPSYGGQQAYEAQRGYGGLQSLQGQQSQGQQSYGGHQAFGAQQSYGGHQSYPDQQSYRGQPNINAKPRLQYRCREDNQQYDCVFYDVHINAQTLATHDVIFGFDDVTLNSQKNVTFKNSTMRTLPETFLRSFGQVELLNLNDLQIEEVESNAFETANTIQKLHMSFNAIRYLPPNAFQNLRSLTELLLDRNMLKNLPRTMFYGTPNLTVLSISNNNLELIEDGTFQANSALQLLEMVSNKLTHFDLSRVPSLYHGNFSFNQLTTLALPVSVESLDASHNRINVVRGPENENLFLLKLQHNNLNDTAWLLSYPGLIEVDLSYNELEKITFRHFVNMKRLQRLYVSNNRLVALNLGNGPIPTLNVLDLSYNHLVHVERNQAQFDTVEYLNLHHNSIVTLKLASNHSVKVLTLSHNDWDCKNLRELLEITPPPTASDRDQSCKIDYQLEHNLCCKESEKPYLDRLIQYILETTAAEKLQRAQGRCSAEDAITSVQSLSHFITEKGGEQLPSNQQLQAEVKVLDTEVHSLTNQQTQLEHLLQNLHTEIDANLRLYRLQKDGLARPSDNLKKVFTHLKERHAFKLRESQARRGEANSKQSETETLEQENIALQTQLDNRKEVLNQLKQETTLKRKKVKMLEAKKNRNPDTRHITK
uniref:LRIM1/APL1C-like dimerization domain-containing protein n=1 Tax=Anopheles christyi TaxID=43041 RepID=A0A9I3A6N1_9DIPT